MTTINWKGISWAVRDTSGQLSGPGPNRFSASAQNAWVDPEGHLHLAIRKGSDGKLYSTELDGPHLGYGTYRWLVNTDPRLLGSQSVLGLFTYDNAAAEGPPYFAREMDVEFAKWSTPDNVEPIMFSVQGGCVQAIRGGPPPINCYFTWSPGQVKFGARDGNGVNLGEFTCFKTVQVPGSEVVIMNLWHSDPDVNPGSPEEVVITDFSFTKLGDITPPVVGLGFLVGDRVRIVHTTSKYNNRTGTVRSVHNELTPPTCGVRLDNGQLRSFRQDWLQRL